MTPPNVPTPSSQPQRKPDPQSPLGRNGDPMGEGAASGTAASYSPRRAGVVIRASVEHICLVGDTELTVSVKWPASTFCVQPCEEPAPPPCQDPCSQSVPGNGPEAENFGILYGEESDPTPLELARENLNLIKHDGAQSVTEPSSGAEESEKQEGAGSGRKTTTGNKDEVS